MEEVDLVKEDYYTEPYKQFNLQRRLTSLCAQLRIGSRRACSNLRCLMFEKNQLKNPELFWLLSKTDVLSWLFNEEMFVLAKLIEIP